MDYESEVARGKSRYEQRAAGDARGRSTDVDAGIIMATIIARTDSHAGVDAIATIIKR